MAAPMWSTAVDKYICDDVDSSVQVVLKVLLSGDVKLLDIVEGIGKYLTHSDNNKRGRSTRLLADVLHGIPTDFLSSKEVDVLSSFLCGRLSDHHSVQPSAIQGILALSTYESLPDGVAERICLELYKEVQVQTLAQGDRRSVYVLLSNLLYKKLPELQKMEGDFVCGYIQAMDAERDPRNLVIAFQLARTIINHFSLGVFVEEMFEVTSCYFPVDFKSSPKDPGAVSKEELERGVLQCMTATPKFGQYCLPLLIEKLSSEILSAKIASLEVLIHGCEVYGTECINEFTSTLFSCIKREVFSGVSEELTSKALSALTAVVKTLSQGVTQRDSPKSYLSEYIKEILKECRRHLLEPDLRLITPSCRLLQSAASASDPACWLVLSSVLPTLLEQFATHTQENQRMSIINNLRGFLDVTKHFAFTEKAPSPLKEYKAALLEIVTSAVNEEAPSVRQAGLQGQITLIELDGILALDEVAALGEAAVKSLLSDQDENVRSGCVNVLKSVAAQDISVMKNKLLPDLIAALNCDPMETNSERYVPDKGYLLTVLTSLATHPEVLDLVVPQLISHLTSNTEQLNVVSAQCLSRLSKESRNNTDISEYIYEQVLPKLLAVLVNASEVHGDSEQPCEELLKEVASVFRHITITLDRRKAENIQKTVLDLFVSGNTSVIPGASSQHFKPMQFPFLLHFLQQSSSPAPQTRLICVLQAVLCSLPREVVIQDIRTLLNSLLQLATQSTDVFTSLSAMKCCAGLVNKAPTDTVESFLKKTHDDLSAVLDLSPPDPGQGRIMNLWVWLTKALVLRGHTLSSVFIKKLLSLLDNPDLGLSAANGFLTIVSEFEDILTSEMKAHIQIFYRQKLFIENITFLTDNFKTAKENTKSCYLMTISHLLRFLPKQVLLADLKSLMPVLTQSLLCSEPELLISTLTKLTQLTGDAPDVLATYLDSLIPQLLRLASAASGMRVRIGALQCLNALTSLPTHVTLTHKGQVTRSLQRVLDDKKRLVRREAVTARGNWFLIGEPGK